MHHGSGTNNTYSCVRRVDPASSLDDILCSFTCYDAGRVEVPCPQDQPEGYGEYYDLTTDQYQTVNTALGLDPTLRATLLATIDAMKTCSGQAQCQGL